MLFLFFNIRDSQGSILTLNPELKPASFKTFALVKAV